MGCCHGEPIFVCEEGRKVEEGQITCDMVGDEEGKVEAGHITCGMVGDEEGKVEAGHITCGVVMESPSLSVTRIGWLKPD